MISKTISITIPEKLVNDLQKEANEVGISRSRFIGNILLSWQKNINVLINDCINQDNGYCNEFHMSCTAPQKEAETCVAYTSSKKLTNK